MYACICVLTTNIAVSSWAFVLLVKLFYALIYVGLQLLHCISFDPDVEGGESILVDGIAAANEVRLRFVDQHDTYVIETFFMSCHAYDVKKTITGLTVSL